MRVYDVVRKLQDLRRLTWDERATSSGTSGCFLKAREGSGAAARYYKLSCYDSYRGIYGHECANEVVAARLFGILGIEHVRYRLVHALVLVDGVEHETWLDVSPSFRANGEKKQAFDLFYDLNRLPGESPFDLCERYGWLERVHQMLVADYLIANRDRHGANIEVIREAGGGVRLAPLFDNGLSFVFSCYGDERRVERFDPLEDVAANNYLGTRSLEENLRFVPADLALRPLEPRHRDLLFAGLEGVLPQAHQSKMWDIMWERWCRHEAFRDR